MKEYTPLYKQIEETFINQIELGILKQGDHIPSEKEITKTFHVSQITAKNALNNLAEKGYVKRIKGKGTFVDLYDKTKKDLTIGIIFTTLDTDIDKSLLNYLEKFARQENIRFYFGLSRESIDEEIELINHFIRCGVEGLIIFPTESEKFNEDILKLHLQEFPLVLVDRYFHKLEINSITSNNFKGGFELANLSINSGYNKLSFITTSEENSATIDRMKGIERAFISNNQPINKNLWLTVPSKIKENTEIITFLERNKPDCIITVNAHISELIAEYTQENKIFHLSFDNPEGCNYYVEQDIQAIANNAIDVLKQIIINHTYTPALTVIQVNVKKGSLES